MQTINYFCRFIISVNTSLYTNHQLFLSLYYFSQYQSVCKPSTISLFLFRQSIPVCMQTINYFSLFISSVNTSLYETINCFCLFISSIPVCMQTINYFCLFIMSVNTSLYAYHQLFLSLYFVNTSLYANHQLFLSFYYGSQYPSICKPSIISVSLVCQLIPVCMQNINYFCIFIMSVSTSLYDTINYFCLFISSIPICMQTINYFCRFIISVNTSLVNRKLGLK